jgi:pimeloyl-ACP methyl ester carboxylesterase
VLHGGGPGCTSAGDFGAVSDELAGRELVFIDLAQYGHSPAPRIDGGAADFHAALLANRLDDLGLRRVDVLAQSLGGTVIIALAASRPDLVGRVLALGPQPVPLPPGDPRAALGRKVRERYYGAGDPTVADMRALIASLEWHDPGAVPDTLVALRHVDSLLPGPRLFGVDHAGRGVPQDLSDRLGRVGVPVLLVWGEHDPFSDAKYAQRLAAQLPDARLEILPRTAHHPQSEQPAAVAALVRGFLS